MEGVFTFLGAITGHGAPMVIAHLILVAIIAILIAKNATNLSKLFQVDVKMLWKRI